MSIRLSFLAMIISLLSCSRNKNVILKDIKIIDYPSGSGIEYFNNQVYIIGDDANNLLITDSSLVPTDSVLLYDFMERRIPKKIKPDLEAITRWQGNKLLLLGSGSVSRYRDKGWLIDPVAGKKDSIRLDTFYNMINAYGPEEINIEGACMIPGSLILSNRGSKGYRKNHLIITSKDFWKDQAKSSIRLISIGSNTDTSLFNGVSGLAYADKSDRLLITVSTEDTKNAVDDGAIGKSYLWIIENISSKKRWKAINPNRVIDLTEVDPRFTGQKIESVCVIQETKNFLHLLLVSDNDDGMSTIFRMVVEKD